MGVDDFERHPRGPRLYVLQRRVHVLVDWTERLWPMSLCGATLVIAGWMVLNDRRDLRRAGHRE